MVEQFFDNGTLINKQGEISVAEAFKNSKLIGLYFSMKDCAPCQQFTPVFAELYNEMNINEKVIEVVYLSGDKTQSEYDEYYAKMPWLALPRGDPRIQKLAK